MSPWRRWGTVVSITMIVAVFAPLALDPLEGDSYPLSTYPMFSSKRPGTLPYLAMVGLRPGGGDVTVSLDYVGSKLTLQSVQIIRRALKEGPQAKSALCRSVAQRIVDAADPAFAEVTHLAIVRLQIDAVKYMEGDTLPESKKVLARCPLRSP